MFDAIEPSPFRDRDLDPKAEEFIVGWAKEPAPRRIACVGGASSFEMKQPCDEVVIGGGVLGVPCEEGSHQWVLAATIPGSSMAFIDSTVVKVALPALQSNLHATMVDAQWVIES